jgi:hypothetical protein
MEIEWIGKNRKAIAPLRVSSGGQEGNTSWITQKRDCEEYCRHHDLELIEAVQIVESASKSELRKKYSEVLRTAAKQNIQHVLFHRYDRDEILPTTRITKPWSAKARLFFTISLTERYSIRTALIPIFSIVTFKP